MSRHETRIAPEHMPSTPGVLDRDVIGIISARCNVRTRANMRAVCRTMRDSVPKPSRREKGLRMLLYELRSVNDVYIRKRGLRRTIESLLHWSSLGADKDRAILDALCARRETVERMLRYRPAKGSRHAHAWKARVDNLVCDIVMDV